MRRAAITVAMTVLATGCSLDRSGTADDVTTLDSAIEPVDTAVAGDSTAIFDAADEDTNVDGAPADTIVDAMDAGCPPAKGGARPCDEIPAREALAAGQVLDARSEDFCDVPYVDFDNTKGALRVPTTMPTAGEATVRIRVAWSSFGIHAHLSVKDANVMPHTPATDPNVFLGDSIEIYVAGHASLTGEFNGTTRDVGAHQIVFSATDGTVASRATYFYMGASRGSPPSSLWFARRTSAGYDIELRIPWADLKPPTTPAAGKQIALSWAVNNKYSGDPHTFSTFQVKSPFPSPTTCPTTDPQAYCDDRLWCTPVLL